MERIRIMPAALLLAVMIAVGCGRTATVTEYVIVPEPVFAVQKGFGTEFVDGKVCDAVAPPCPHASAFGVHVAVERHDAFAL